ncbi:hypothetical protein HDU84_005144 [Entophlyctis sp. JEL0112]|nr:hypothetical protein HDU84_005144 [Entophlyctis sp. JEL0112]
MSLVAASRRAFIVWIALSVYLSFKWTQLWLKAVRLGQEYEDSQWAATNERLTLPTPPSNAKRIYRAIVHLQGLWIKVGQYVSTRADVFPEPYIVQLQSLQDAVPTRPLSETEDSIKSALKISALSDLFSDFDEAPIATASIASVHAATLRPDLAPKTTEGTSRRVVVKVQHKGIRNQVIRDLSDLELLIWVIAKFEKNYDFTFIVDEYGKEVPKELDFENEAKNTIEIRDAVAVHNASLTPEMKSSLFLDCGFSDPIFPYVTETVLVMSFIDGRKITDLSITNSKDLDLNNVVTSIVKAYAFQIFVLGFWNSDPHPGNFLISHNSTLSEFVPYLLDFGLTKRAAPHEAMAISRLLLSAYHKDFAGLQSALVDLGVKGMTDNLEVETSMEIVQFVFRTTKTREESAQEQLKLREQRDARSANRKKKAKQQPPKKKASQRRITDAFPGVLVFFARVLDLLRGLCTSVDMQIDYIGVMAPFAEHFLRAQTRIVRFGGLSIEQNVSSNSPQDRVIAFLREKIDAGECLGAQVVVLSEGEVVVDIAAGVMGLYDPRPVLHDSLFPIFSVTKAITAAVLHHQISLGRLSLDDKVVSIWPEFVSRLPATATDEQRIWKSSITVRHLLSHQSGLAMAGSDLTGPDAFAITDFDTMVSSMEEAVPIHEPGLQTQYHFLSFGWLVAGLAQKIAVTKFSELVQNLLDGVGVGPLGYVGIPKGVEERLATLFWDSAEMAVIVKSMNLNAAGGNTQEAITAPAAASFDKNSNDSAVFSSSGFRLNPLMANPTFFNHLRIRKSIVPAASGNFSARGLALVMDHILACQPSKQWHHKHSELRANWKLPTASTAIPLVSSALAASFGASDLNAPFHLGFAQYKDNEKMSKAFGHSGMGGSMVLVHPEQNLTIAIVVNKLSLMNSTIGKGVVRIVTGLNLDGVADVSMNPLS